MKKEDNHFHCLEFSIEMFFQMSSQLVARSSTTWANSRLCTLLRCPSPFTDVYWVTRRSLITHCTDSCGKESGSSSSQPLNLKKKQKKPRTSGFTQLFKSETAIDMKSLCFPNAQESESESERRALRVTESTSVTVERHRRAGDMRF